MSCRDLAIRGLQQIGVSTLQDARSCAGESLCRRKARCMLAQRFSAAASLHAEHFHLRVTEKCVKQSNGIRSAADARKQMIGEPSFHAQNLFASFFADNFLKIAHNLRVRVSTEN